MNKINYIDYKVTGGKLLRIKFKIKNNVIDFIKIRGDFFIYPESALFKIENFLHHKELKNLATELSQYINQEKIEVIGFSPEDLELALHYNN